MDVSVKNEQQYKNLYYYFINKINMKKNKDNCGSVISQLMNGNSSDNIRVYSSHYIYVNRGVNGIEGSLSTAAGYSVAVKDKTFIVIGDLSFFYDANALWNKNINGNLRIILLNNGCGGIFSTLKGLENSPSRDECVAASHNTTAEGLCKSYGVKYLSASSHDELSTCLTALFEQDTSVPMLLEVS